MKYRKLGHTGFEVSDIAHGLWGMGGWSESDDEESLKALQLAVELGCNFLDSAWAYGDGKSDGLIGEIIARNPHKRLYAASKIPPKNLQWPASPKYKYHDVFPPDHVFTYADLIRKTSAWRRLTFSSFMFGTTPGPRSRISATQSRNSNETA